MKFSISDVEAAIDSWRRCSSSDEAFVASVEARALARLYGAVIVHGCAVVSDTELDDAQRDALRVLSISHPRAMEKGDFMTGHRRLTEAMEAVANIAAPPGTLSTVQLQLTLDRMTSHASEIEAVYLALRQRGVAEADLGVAVSTLTAGDVAPWVEALKLTGQMKQ
ncbi:uncharacterized protein DUF3717 [Paraburkholderia sp. BL23I1N1]|uniref:DUF3717 domain-containing protein n=1 Tax=Paraburkholderia sp. BL23I1N1 TaxID=1938802 RepID=UPI000E75F11C|nr:DUF3717 domain-containing protein [Paraburkholderia sp. BL23I1N1]RKE23911.1 uncharacterized protein DUF3717 [Paraburkholderia sp. BL23I1N1]